MECMNFHLFLFLMLFLTLLKNSTPALDNLVLMIVSLHSYRKIPGDKCEGGTMPDRKEIDLSQRCVSDLVGPQALVSSPQSRTLKLPVCMCDLLVNMCFLSFATQIETSSSKTAPIVVTVVIIMLLSVAGGVLFVKKYVCGGRSDVSSCCVFPSAFVRRGCDGDLTAAAMVSLQVPGSQVLGAATARGGSRCRHHGRAAGDGPQSERQDWVSRRLGWGRYLFVLAHKGWHRNCFASTVETSCILCAVTNACWFIHVRKMFRRQNIVRQEKTKVTTANNCFCFFYSYQYNPFKLCTPAAECMSSNSGYWPMKIQLKSKYSCTSPRKKKSKGSLCAFSFLWFLSQISRHAGKWSVRL